MNRVAILLMAGILVPAAAYAQTAARRSSGGIGTISSRRKRKHAKGRRASLGQRFSIRASEWFGRGRSKNALALSEGTTMNAALAGSLDVKKNKPGDRIEARTTQDVKQDGKVVLRKGTHLIGHVTEVQARAKDQTQSQLGVAFDHAELRDGQQVPLNASIQALAAAQSTAQASAGDDDLIASGGGAASAAGSGAAGGGRAVGGAAGGALGGATRARWKHGGRSRQRREQRARLDGERGRAFHGRCGRARRQRCAGIEQQGRVRAAGTVA